MTGMKKYIVALAALVLVSCGPKEDQFVDAKTASERQARGELILDVRAADDFKEFHIPDSMNIPFGRLKVRMAELEAYKGKPIIVADHSAIRSPRAWEQLKKAGFTQVYVLKGGVAEWKETGLPIFTMEMQMEKEQELQRQLDELEQMMRE